MPPFENDPSRQPGSPADPQYDVSATPGASSEAEGAAAHIAELPALPRVPHPYAATPAREVVTRSPRLGALRIHYRAAVVSNALNRRNLAMRATASWNY